MIGISHDFGKANPLFQKKITENFKTSKANHAMISGVWTYYVVKNFIRKNKSPVDDLNLPLISYLVVTRHHTDLQDIYGNSGEFGGLKDKLDELEEQIQKISENKDELSEIYRELCEVEICDVDKFINGFKNILCELINEFKEKEEGGIYYYLTIIFLYSILLDADKLNASNTSLPYRISIDPNSVNNYIEKKFHNSKEEIDKKRMELHDEIDKFICRFDPSRHKMLSIELPTGSGKTLLSFSLALKMRKKINKMLNIMPRIIYTLPYLSIIDQNGNVFKEVLTYNNLETNEYGKNLDNTDIIPNKPELDVSSDILLIHHHLADMFFKTDEMEFDISRSRILTEGWNSEIVLTTFVQLFHSLITNKNNSVRKFHKIVNSIIILDEVQNIPLKYWNLVSGILRTLGEKYNTWIILMTATMPMILDRGELCNIIENSDQYYQSFNRVNYEYNHKVQTMDDLFNRIISDVEDEKINGDLLIVLNRISAVKDLYMKLKNYFNGEVDQFGVLINEEKKIKIINLSTNIVPVHRLKRINEIKKKDCFKKIIISTQLIEAGVDISARKVYRDIAPIDSIIQSGGRCNRGNEYGNLGGNVIILDLKDNGNPYWKYVYDQVLIELARQVLREKFEDKEIKEIVQSYFKELTSRKAKDKTILDSIENYRFSKLSEFKLIEENYPKDDVFIEIDENAAEILKKFRELSKINNPIDRKNEFLKFKGSFYNYVISVPKEVLSMLMAEEINGIQVLTKDNLNSKYDPETGINLNTNSLIL